MSAKHEIKAGQIVKLKFTGEVNGRKIDRSTYRGRVVEIIACKTAWDDAVIVWFREAKAEMGKIGTFPTDELQAA